MSKAIKKEILKRVNFFNKFFYFPTKDQLFKFLRIKINKQKFEEVLEELKKENKLLFFRFDGKERFFVLEKSSNKAKKEFENRVREYRKKLTIWRIKLYLRLLSLLPQIRFVGLSGSLAWEAVDKDDDIDLFIITKRKRLWTARFLAVIFAVLFGIKRKRGVKKAKDKVCLNLFFDEANLKIPKEKQNEYVAFEVLALKPIFDKGVYEKLIGENRDFIKKYFPNAKFEFDLESREKREKRRKFFQIIGDFFESILKKIQLFLINRHKTLEYITSTQLWFFPEDFEKEYRRKLNQSN